MASRPGTVSQPINQRDSCVQKSIDPSNKYMTKKNGISKLTVNCVGDIALVGGRAGNVSKTDVGDIFQSASKSLPQNDLTLANLEAPVASQASCRVNKRYNLCADASALDLFGSRSVISLANNHIMDYGDEGLAETIAALNARGIVYAGAGRNLQEASKPALIDVEGVRVAVLCCADSRFQASTDHRAGTCPAK